MSLATLTRTSVDPDLVITAATYNADGTVATRTDVAGTLGTSTFGYDRRGRLIAVTPEHPFRTVGRGSVPAADLRISDAIVSLTGSQGIVEAIAWDRGPDQMWDLTIETAHTYTVGPGGWLVHNDCLGDLSPTDIDSTQDVVNQAGRPLGVVGSAATGGRRGIDTDLPYGKGPGTRSDTDYTTAGAHQDFFGPYADGLPGLDDHGLLSGTHDPRLGPAVRFEPFTDPRYVPGG